MLPHRFKQGVLGANLWASGGGTARRLLNIEDLRAGRILVEMFLSLLHTRHLPLPFNDPVINPA